MAAQETDSRGSAPKRAVSATIAFREAHGGSGRAVVSNLGRCGARIVLIGEDGALGDVIVPDVAAAAAVLDQVSGMHASQWDSETAAALRIGPEFRRRMAGPRARLMTPRFDLFSRHAARLFAPSFSSVYLFSVS